ncbi:MAG: hypothetical protein DRJ52_02485 [Thermoprotei archaeon]|nr:MAG: hypothetical protein DRJ52_02485 [Thermoprotei archaeon]RLF00644.1 MAG: hypothetical protein DRJ63_01765 [Thermoprotei archaeon]
MIDVSSYIGSLPKRSCRLTLEEMIALAKRHGIKYMVVSHTSSHLSRSPLYGNKVVAEISRKYRELYAAIVVNPSLLIDKSIVSSDKIRVIRVSPLYHGYSLVNEKYSKKLAEIIVETELPLHIPLRLHFTEPYQVKVLDVREFALKNRDLGIIVGGFNYDLLLEVISFLGNLDNVYLEISLLQSYRGVETLVDVMGADRILFGTNMPFSYPLASILKVTKAEISEKFKRMILEENAKKLIGIN